jgi:hypothetical protein
VIGKEPITNIDKLCKSWVRTFLTFELVLSIQLMSAILNEGREVRDELEIDVSDMWDDVSRLLPFRE